MNSFFHRSILFLIPGLLVTSNVMSRDINFNYVQITYAFDTVDFTASTDKIEGNGIGIALSLDFNPNFAFTLAALETTFDTYQDRSVDSAKAMTIGVTAHTNVSSGTDILGNVSVVDANLTATNGAGSASDDDIGYMARIGLRHMVTEIFELEVGGSHVSVFNAEKDILNVDGRLYYKNISFGLGYKAADNIESLSLNFRMDV